MRNVRQIIEDAGGPQKIAEAARKTRWKIKSKSVYDWPRIGIPEKHWPVMIRLAETSPQELHEANEVARGVRARPKRKQRVSPAVALLARVA